MSNCIYIILLMQIVSVGCMAQENLYRENETMIEGDVKIVDEENQHIPGAEVELLFKSTLRQSEVEKRGVSFVVNKVTNEMGQVSFEENALSLRIKAHKKDYWTSIIRMGRTRDINKLRLSQVPTENEFWQIRWQPTIMLPRKINPRPMYAGEFRGTLPKLNVTYAFDLEINDWVRPHGKGEKKDMLFTFEGVATSKPQPPGSLRTVPIISYDVSLTVHFPNKGDGILPVDDSEFPGSEILLARVAPVDGYQDQLVFRRTVPNVSNVKKEPAGYWFRVRTQTDPNTGKVVNANYGKIRGDFNFVFNYTRGVSKGSLVFQYMFSPDHQRSMEFSGENLLKDGHWPLGGESR